MKAIVSKTLLATLGAAGALAVATGANADTQVQVQSGDTVWNFAQQYESTVDAITQRNQLANPNYIQVGQQLIIPDSATSAVSQAASAANVVATNATSVTATSNAVTSTTTNVTTASATPTTSTASFTATPVNLSSSTASSATSLNSATTVLSSTPASAAATANQANTSTATSQTDYAANSAAALQSMSNYVISYGTVEETAASHNNGSQTAQAAQQTQTAATTNQTSNTTSANNSGAVATAKSMIGVPYVWGGNTPSGFDCSGLVQYSYNLGPNYRTTYQQTNLGTHKYDVENAQSGDLYFWGTESAPYHVAIAEGSGNYIQAPTPGQNVQEGNIQYYRPNYYISMNQN
ncbi:NlpC/P60 family protein [Limosilactobacillus pontis]|uniref:NlpC/P60 family protein n=1 Tax=Limosilactobacillus pontis TaxID=35787 RepID=A0ABU7SQD2_9LACO